MPNKSTQTDETNPQKLNDEQVDDRGYIGSTVRSSIKVGRFGKVHVHEEELQQRNSSGKVDALFSSVAEVTKKNQASNDPTLGLGFLAGVVLLLIMRFFTIKNKLN